MSWDFGNLIFGMVLPFFAMVGAFIGLLATFVMNPILYQTGILKSWKPGDEHHQHAVPQQRRFLLQLPDRHRHRHRGGGIWQVIRACAIPAMPADRQARRCRAPRMAAVPEGRGDIKTWIIITGLFLRHHDLHRRVGLADRLAPRRDARAALPRVRLHAR
jgi:hypothetical protein